MQMYVAVLVFQAKCVSSLARKRVHLILAVFNLKNNFAVKFVR